LLALQGGPEDERVARSVEYLRQHALTSDDVEHVAWATLALDAYRAAGVPAETVPALHDALRAACEARASTPSLHEAPLRQALVALARDVERRNPSRLPAEAPAKPALDPGRLAVPRRPLGERVRSFIQGLAVNAA